MVYASNDEFEDLISDIKEVINLRETDDECDIYYTLDGSTPTVKSIKYKGTFEAFRLGEVTIKAIALRDNYFDSDITTFTYTRKSHTLSDSINISGVNVKSTGASPWFRVLGDESYDGVEAIRSGAIGAGEASAVEMTVYGNGTISFWWKVSCHEDPRGGNYLCIPRSVLRRRLQGTRLALWRGISER